jgi:NAD(P)-dependent dehydrogenase (short-subunit alcohol dehydrogenase family)
MSLIRPTSRALVAAHPRIDVLVNNVADDPGGAPAQDNNDDSWALNVMSGVPFAALPAGNAGATGTDHLIQ